MLAKGPDDFPNGPTYQKAMKEFLRLQFGGEATVTLGELKDKYLIWLKSHRKAATLKIRTERLSPLCKDLGEKPCDALTSYDLETWCDTAKEKKGWSASTVKLTLLSVKACLNWGADKGVIPKNPVRKLEMPADESRGIEYVLTPEQEAAALKAVKRATRDLLTILRDTGCRPGEAAMAEARHFNPDLRAIVLPAQDRQTGRSHKTARSGKPRIIYLRGESLALVQQLCRRYPTGPLLRTPRVKVKGEHKGTRWGWTDHNIGQVFRRLQDKTGIKRLIAYSFRHTFAVRWLRAGKPKEVLAEVLGTSTEMIDRHYGHLADQRDYIRRLVDELDGPAAGG